MVSRNMLSLFTHGSTSHCSDVERKLHAHNARMEVQDLVFRSGYERVKSLSSFVFIVFRSHVPIAVRVCLYVWIAVLYGFESDFEG